MVPDSIPGGQICKISLLSGKQPDGKLSHLMASWGQHWRQHALSKPSFPQKCAVCSEFAGFRPKPNILMHNVKNGINMNQRSIVNMSHNKICRQGAKQYDKQAQKQQKQEIAQECQKKGETEPNLNCCAASFLAMSVPFLF
jgi:hypothetical protein